MDQIRLFWLLLVLLCPGFPTLAQTLQADARQSTLKFIAVQQDAEFEGAFPEFEATVELAQSEPFLRVQAVIDMTAVDTKNEERDEYLRSEEFFDSKQFPEAVFNAQSLDLKNGQFVADGTLTIKQHQRPVSMTFTFNPATSRLTGSLTINRLEYEVGSGMWTDTTWIGAEVTIEVNALLKPARTPGDPDS